MLSWSDRNTDSFPNKQDQLKNVLKTARRDNEKSLCLNTYASDSYWAEVMTQCAPGELDKEVSNQPHQLHAFSGISFAGDQKQ